MIKFEHIYKNIDFKAKINFDSQVTSLTLGLRMIYRFYVFDKLQNYDTSSIKSLSLGGTKLKPEIMKFLKLMVPNGYLQLVYGQ